MLLLCSGNAFMTLNDLTVYNIKNKHACTHVNIPCIHVIRIPFIEQDSQSNLERKVENNEFK